MGAARGKEEKGRDEYEIVITYLFFLRQHPKLFMLQSLSILIHTMQRSITVEERLATIEQAITNLECYLKSDTKEDINKLEQYLREYDKSNKRDIVRLRDFIVKSNARCDKTFRWIIGIVVTAFVSIVLVVLALCTV